MLKLVQLSDCHVTASKDITYRGQDPRASLQSIVERITAWAPDLVLATGDLSEDASDSSYAFLREQFERIKAPVWITAGNHDDAQSLARTFSRTALDAPVRVHDGDWQVIMLNSARDGEIPGRLDVEQLDALRTLMADDPRPALLALHHQPWPVESPWIDRYPLTNPEAFLDVLDDGPEQQLVLWGHVHQALKQQHILPSGKTVTGLAGPSTVCNSLPAQPHFKLDAAGPACRWLELNAIGVWRSGLLRASERC